MPKNTSANSTQIKEREETRNPHAKGKKRKLTHMNEKEKPLTLLDNHRFLRSQRQRRH